jgi:hypothetical protein
MAMAWIKYSLAAVAVAALPFQFGCTNVDCGDGTTEVDGECVPADSQVPEDNCGPGT